jgi:hypothetical protein
VRQGEEKMNLPATVKMLKIAPFVVLSLAFVNLDLLGADVLAQQNRSTQADPKADGSYLYGESPQPNQISKKYVVFQRQKGKVVGAVYSPHSEFSCFTGSQTNNTLDVKSVAVGEPKSGAVKINLSKLHQINSISTNEQHILSMCKQATVALTNR